MQTSCLLIRRFLGGEGLTNTDEGDVKGSGELKGIETKVRTVDLRERKPRRSGTARILSTWDRKYKAGELFKL